MEEIAIDFAAGGSPAAAVDREGRDLLTCYQQFLGHDLPNGLVGVQGLARTLLVDGAAEPPERLRAALEQLADLVRQTDEAVRRLAALGRLIRDREAPAPVDLSELCREAIAEARWSLSTSAGACAVRADLPAASVSARLVREALVQVLRNAFAAGSPDRPARVDISGEGKDGAAVLHVHDDGRGLSPDQLRRLADLWSTGLPGPPRTGRGWFVVRHLLAAHAGALRVRSGLGLGTTVSMTFRSW